MTVHFTERFHRRVNWLPGSWHLPNCRFVAKQETDGAVFILSWKSLSSSVFTILNFKDSSPLTLPSNERPSRCVNKLMFDPVQVPDERQSTIRQESAEIIYFTLSLTINNQAPIGPTLTTMGQTTGGRLFSAKVKED